MKLFVTEAKLEKIVEETIRKKREAKKAHVAQEKKIAKTYKKMREKSLKKAKKKTYIPPGYSILPKDVWKTGGRAAWTFVTNTGVEVIPTQIAHGEVCWVVGYTSETFHTNLQGLVWSSERLRYTVELSASYRVFCKRK